MKTLKHPEYMGFWAKYYGDTIQATNIIVKLPAKSLSEKEAGNIIVSAHLDSKSQSYKTVWRIIIYRIWLFGGIFLGLLYILLLIYYFIPNSLKLYFNQLTIFNQVLLVINLLLITLTVLVSASNIFLMFSLWCH